MKIVKSYTTNTAEVIFAINQALASSPVGGRRGGCGNGFFDIFTENMEAYGNESVTDAYKKVRKRGNGAEGISHTAYNWDLRWLKNIRFIDDPNVYHVGYLQSPKLISDLVELIEEYTGGDSTIVEESDGWSDSFVAEMVKYCSKQYSGTQYLNRDTDHPSISIAVFYFDLRWLDDVHYTSKETIDNLSVKPFDQLIEMFEEDIDDADVYRLLYQEVGASYPGVLMINSDELGDYFVEYNGIRLPLRCFSNKEEAVFFDKKAGCTLEEVAIDEPVVISGLEYAGLSARSRAPEVVCIKVASLEEIKKTLSKKGYGLGETYFNEACMSDTCGITLTADQAERFKNTTVNQGGMSINGFFWELSWFSVEIESK